jgi:hypothetical protein
MKAIEYDLHSKFGGVGITIFPYQIALGCSLRYWSGMPAFRLYLGPIKLWGYIRVK